MLLRFRCVFAALLFSSLLQFKLAWSHFGFFKKRAEKIEFIHRSEEADHCAECAAFSVFDGGDGSSSDSRFLRKFNLTDIEIKSVTLDSIANGLFQTDVISIKKLINAHYF